MTNEDSSIAISCRGVERTYGAGRDAFTAVRGVDLDVPAGSITALLGTNGAGKTSTVELIEGLAPAAAGEIRVLGLDPWRDREAVRRRTGVLLQASGFSGDLTVRETMRMQASLTSTARPIDAALDDLALLDKAETRVGQLSGGEQRRLDIACALLGDPAVLFLDEPSNGLDVESRRRVWDLVAALRDRGAAILLTTHYLDEAQRLADRIELMHAGRIERSGSPADIVADLPSTISFATSSLRSAPPLPDLGQLRVVEHRGTATIETHELQGSLGALLAWASSHDVHLDELRAETASLERAFLALTSKDSSSKDRGSSEHPDQTKEHAA
ncbi:ABC transporter ATP-binding protein [Nocardioides currus]|uniref:Multidrug ABC transporter ATP-binding protein n=1 Tax=Nocardioides currus TaxID=2133958 RepID=A0A2R7YY10_9ACTN|nr:ABC transporter ATP-binding protein [Nocardioides currus]PUA81184.1 multidrug ABC transporter ATP-binding protein [Nocardioides currus]